MSKKKEVWAVIAADIQCDDPQYWGWVELFATKEAAMRCLRENVRQEAESLETKANWPEKHGRMLAVINDRIMNRVEKLEVKS